MLVLGAIVLLIAIIVTIIVLASGGQSVSINLHWGTLHTNSAAVFVIGAVCLALAVIGLWLLLAGLRGGYRRRKEIRSLRDRAEGRDRTRADSKRSDRPAPASRSTTSRDASTSSEAKAPENTGADDYFDTAPKDEGTR